MTYHPSSTHDTATEVTVASGAEASGVDIQFRGGPGYIVSGTVTTTAPSSTHISLINTDISAVTGSGYVRPDDPRKGFMIRGLIMGITKLSPTAMTVERLSPPLLHAA